MKTILFIGDIVGKTGRISTRQIIPDLKKEFSPDLIIANGENSAGGAGINEKKYRELIELGIDVITLGNHVWHNKEFIKEISHCNRVVRPANFPPGAPGLDRIVYKDIGVINLLGRVFMKEMDCPFRSAGKIASELRNEVNIIIIDIHAEATSEKYALGWYLDGKVSAVLGTHTHVQTADERILPNGTAYITDIGMVGSLNSVIGVEKDTIVERFLTLMPKNFEVAKEWPVVFNAVVIAVDENTGKAVDIKRINRIIESNANG